LSRCARRMRAGRAHARHDRLTGRGLRHRSQSPRRRPPPIGRGPSHRVCGRGHGTVPNCPHARRAKMVFWSSQFATVSAEWWSCFTSSLQHKPKMAAHGSTLRPQSCSCAIRQRRTSNTCPLDAAAASAYPGPSGSAASLTARTSAPAMRTTATAGRSGRCRAGPENATWIRIKQHAAPGCFRCIGVSPLVHGVAGVWLRLASMHLWGFCCVLSPRVR
jgi:hypothetical protein